MSESSQKKVKEESKILEKSEARDNVVDHVSSSGPIQESHMLNSSSNSLKKSNIGNNIEKKRKRRRK